MEVASRYQNQDQARRPLFGMEKNGQTEESGTEGESQIRRKFQRTTDQNADFAFRKPSLPASAMKAATDVKTSQQSRRRSALRDTKPLLGPRPFDSSTSAAKSDSSVVASKTSEASLLPNSTSLPVLDTKKSKDKRLSFGVRRSHAPPSNLPVSTSTIEFLPPVSFDDFQTSISAYEPRLSNDSTSNLSLGAGTNSVVPRPQRVSSIPVDTGSPKKGNDSTDGTATTQKGKPTLSRQSSLAKRSEASQIKSESQPQSAYSAPLSLRQRRQSHVPPVSTQTANNTRPPRKSVGPGMLSGMLGTKRNEMEALPTAPATTTSTLSRSSSLSKGKQTLLTSQTLPIPNEQSSTVSPNRATKAKSMQPPPRQQAAQLDTNVMTPEQTTTTATNKQTAIKGHLQPTHTPTSSGNKRQSGRMSGLGARTVSPTDARRLKRLSMMPNPLAHGKSSTQLDSEPMPDMPSTARSPSLIPRRAAATPSSARQTPDSMSNKYIPPFSLSTSSSYQSLRSANVAGAARPTQSPSLSKLPTPKPRNVYSSAERHDEELVPPVPAIPKAYESPKDQMDNPFFSSRKASVEHPLLSAPTNVAPDAKSTTKEPRSSDESNIQKKEDSPGHRRTRTVAAPGTQEKMAPPRMHKGKNLQPLRLPPLTLLPLNTPTASKIAALPAPSAELDQRDVTPPPKRIFSKTPSTPMTASKATFMQRYDDGEPPNMNLRSSSSHYALRPMPEYGHMDGLDRSAPMAMPMSGKRQVTPFSSGSVPKSNDEPKGNEHSFDDYTLGHQSIQTQTSKPMGPRPRTLSKAMTETNLASTKHHHVDTSTTAEEETDAPASATSIRRKLSFSWRRSSSKNASRAAHDQAQETNGQKVEETPVPKLPSSATWSNGLDNAKTTLQAYQTRSSFDTQAVKSPMSATYPPPDIPFAPAQSRNTPNQDRQETRKLNTARTEQAAGPRATSWSMLGAARQQELNSKASSSSMRGPQHAVRQLDRDDIAANDEMRKLSTRRKEVDNAAKETDALKRMANPKKRMSPAQAVHVASALLNIYERGEIVDFTDGVYFCGTKNAKKHVGDIGTPGTTNFGYDDERGDYNVVIGDHLSYRYEIIDVLGKGSFGQVVRCIDHKNGGLCAVKIIRNKKRFHQQALVEVNILNKLKEWDPSAAHATLTIISSFYFRSHLCIVTPCLSINLYELIRAHSFVGFSIPLIRRFARQLLSCLQLLQSRRIIHCDLKPENILLCDPRKADIRVIDFGSSCKAEEKVYTYIQSRFYRSPEVILGSEYGLPIDMWSLGCILAELFTGYPIFPGENEQEQLACIMEIFGPPPRELIEKCSRRKLFFDSALKPRVTVSSKGRRRRPSSKTLTSSLKCDDEPFLDFIAQCLRWDPERRLRPDQAISHPFIRNEAMRRIPERTRMRTAAAQNGPTPSGGSGGGIPSPVKRVQTSSAAVSTSSSNAFNQPMNKDNKIRPLPEAPSYMTRNGIPVKPQETAIMSSPNKSSTARRQSSVVTTANAFNNPALAVAGSKRASNGALLQQNAAGLPCSTSLPRVNTGKVDLAGAAARESMGAMARWR